MFPHPFKAEVDLAPGAQYRDQRIGADQQVGPEGQDDEKEEPQARFRRGKDNGDGNGKSDDEANERGEEGHPEGFGKDAEIKRVEGAGILFQRPRNVDAGNAFFFSKAEQPQEREGNEKKHHKPKCWRGKGSPECRTMLAPAVHGVRFQLKIDVEVRPPV